MYSAGVEINTKERDGRVRNTLPKAMSAEQAEIFLLHEFTNNFRKLIGNLLATIAGFTSCKYFLTHKPYYSENPQNYIGIVCSNESKKHIRYFDLETAPKDIRNHDLKKIKDRILHFKKLDKTEIEEFYAELTEDVLEIFQKQSVYDSIGFVKNILIKRDGELIEGVEFRKIVAEINRLNNRTSIQSTIDKYSSTLT